MKNLINKKRKKKDPKKKGNQAGIDRKQKQKVVNAVKTGKTIWVGSPTEPFLDS